MAEHYDARVRQEVRRAIRADRARAQVEVEDWHHRLHAVLPIGPDGPLARVQLRPQVERHQPAVHA